MTEKEFLDKNPLDGEAKMFLALLNKMVDNIFIFYSCFSDKEIENLPEDLNLDEEQQAVMDGFKQYAACSGGDNITTILEATCLRRIIARCHYLLNKINNEKKVIH